MSSEFALKLINGEYKLEDVLTPDFDLKINSSIVQFNSKYYCAYRTDHMDEFDAKNYVTILDENLNPLTHIKLTAENGNTAFEDIRLFIFNNQLLALYTYLPQTGPDKWVWENGIGIGEFDAKNGKLINQQSLRHLANGVQEKNYVPYIHNDTLYIITNFDPKLRIIEVTGDVGFFNFKEFFKSTEKTKGWDFGQLRGGTPFIKCPKKNDNWQYSFIHSSTYLPNGNFVSRFYVYTVLRFDPTTYTFEYYKKPMGYSTNEVDNNGKSTSMPNKRNLAIKVVFPMGVTQYENGVLISYGKDDCVSRLKFYFWDYLIKLLEEDD